MKQRHKTYNKRGIFTRKQGINMSKPASYMLGRSGQVAITFKESPLFRDVFADIINRIFQIGGQR